MSKYCAQNCKTMCQNSVHGMCDGPPTVYTIPATGANESAIPRRFLTPDRAARCELIQAIAKAIAFSFCIDDVQRLGLVVDEAMRKMED